MNNAQHMKKLATELANRDIGLIVLETGLLIILGLAALLANSSVLYVFYKTPRLQTVTSYYLIALAVLDIIKSTVILIPTILASAYSRDVVGQIVGEVIHWINALILNSSMALSMIIAINRYYCVNKPIKYRKYFQPKFAKLSIVLCGLITVPFIIVSFTDEKPLIQFHYGWLTYVAWSPDPITNTVFLVSFEAIMVVIPVCLSLCCYWRVYKKMTNHIAAVAPTLINQSSGTSMNREEANVTRSLTALVVGCAVFWVPSSILYHLDWYMQLPRYVEMIYVFIFFLFSVASPVLYNVFNKSFRREFINVYVGLTCKQPTAERTSRTQAN